MTPAALRAAAIAFAATMVLAALPFAASQAGPGPQGGQGYCPPPSGPNATSPPCHDPCTEPGRPAHARPPHCGQSCAGPQPGPPAHSPPNGTRAPPQRCDDPCMPRGPPAGGNASAPPPGGPGGPCGPCAQMKAGMPAGASADDPEAQARAAMMAHLCGPCGPLTHASAAAGAQAGTRASTPAGDAGARAGAHAGAGARRDVPCVACPPMPVHGPAAGARAGAGAGARANGTGSAGGRAGADARATPQVPPRSCEIHFCGLPPGLGVREHAGARVRAGNATAEAHEGAKVRMQGPPPRPCPPAPCEPRAPPAGAGVDEEARIRAPAGNTTVEAGERAEVGLRLGHGCRDRPGDPHEAHMRAGRRAHAVERAIEHVEGRIERLESAIDRAVDRLASEELGEDEEERLLDRIDGLEERLDRLMARLGNLSKQLQAVLMRWNESTGQGPGPAQGE